MRVLLTTVGSRGDAQPFVALGVGLAAAGHTVTVNTHTRFRSLVEDAGLVFAPLSDAILDFLDSDLGRDAIENSSTPLGWARTIAKSYRAISTAQRSMVDEAWTAAEAAQPDVIVFHQKAFWGTGFAQRLGARAVLATLQPIFGPTSDFPVLGIAAPPRWTGPLHRSYNRGTYRLTHRLADWGTRRYLRDWHQEHHLPQGPALARPDGSPLPLLQAFSPHVVPATYPSHVATTGFWHLAQPDWSPPDDLAAFLDAGPPPVYVGFGSMKGKRGADRARAVIEAVALAGVRAVLALGWGSLDLAEVTLPDTCFVLRGAPHDWLFPRMAAVVHHGGAGTTAAGLRAGRPTVVCPFFGDQPFWGRRVHALGAGPEPLRQKHLTAESLAGRIRTALNDTAMHVRATTLGEQLRAEDGVANAVSFLERYCKRSRR
ncbi:MAG: glycosyltransferase [Bacteroidota bacterium]